MCAIAGVIHMSLGQRDVELMLNTMVRRGPDDQNTYQEQDVCLLHTRLAIIDPQGGRQPMQLSYQGREYIIVYNGELYNTEELRQNLMALGHGFNGHSDTEVVLHAYAQWREECLEKLNGIFAFAVWEKGEKRLFLARDRIGVKPLFYTIQGNALLFASEIKTILAHPDMKPQLDPEGAGQLLLLGPGKLPGSGVFHGIRELEPGYYAWFDGTLETVQYWKLKDKPHEDSYDQTVEYVRYLVLDTIKRQMVSDVPVGTFLSGGLDSSIISAVCAEDLRSRGEALQTFSLDYLNNGIYFTASKFQPESDNRYIDLMQNRIQSKHYWTTLTSPALYQALETAVLARDLPGMADVDSSLLLFCGEIRKYVKVALSGECADEIFGGYPWYRDSEIRAQAGFPWAQNTEMRADLVNSALKTKINPREFVMDAYDMTCRQSDILPECNEEDRRVKEMVNLNFRWFMQTLLDRKDRMSMYHGLEVRVPFCDYRIAEYLYTVPWKMKDHLGKEKGLLRAAMHGILPTQVLYRKKSPYPKTFDPSYETCVTKQLQEIMKTDSPLFALVDKKRIPDLLEGNSPWPWYGQLMRRPQMIAYLLQMEYWLRAYHIELMF